MCNRCIVGKASSLRDAKCYCDSCDSMNPVSIVRITVGRCVDCGHWISQSQKVIVSE